MRPRTSLIILKMIKAGLKDFRIIPHLFDAWFSFCRNYARIRRERDGGKETLMIGLIEHMGDIVAAEPLSRYARNAHPNATIGWATRKPYQEVVENFNAVDRPTIVSCMTEWLLLWSMQTTDVIWDLHISERPCLKCGISFRKVGNPGKITYKTYYDHGNLLAVNCLNADLPPISDAPQITPDSAAVQAVNSLDLPKQIIVIHCKSNEDSRDWNVDKWKVLIAWITSHTEFVVCEIGSKACVVQNSACGTLDLCGSLSIMETAEVIRRAALFIGIDSGPAHLANATGTPGIILLGRYQGFQAYTPYSGGYGDGSLADLIRGDGPAANIPVEPVIAQVANRLRSGRHGKTDGRAYSHVGSIETDRASR